MNQVKNTDYQIFINSTNEYIINVINVPITLDLMLQIIWRNNELSQESGITKIFSDVRKSRNIISMTDNYSLFTDEAKYTKLLDQKASKVAILASIGDHSHYPAETFATNAGYMLKVFFEQDHAHNWLVQ